MSPPLLHTLDFQKYSYPSVHVDAAGLAPFSLPLFAIYCMYHLQYSTSVSVSCNVQTVSEKNWTMGFSSPGKKKVQYEVKFVFILKAITFATE